MFFEDFLKITTYSIVKYKSRISIILFIIYLTSCSKIGIPDETDDTFHTLFNGKNLSGWHRTEHLKDSISNDVILLYNDQSALNGYLLTEKEYENFHLRFEYKLPRLNRVSLLIRYHFIDSLSETYNGYEINMQNTLETQNPTGSIINLARASWPDSIQVEDWNTFEIIANGDYLQCFINGRKVNEIHDRRSNKGKIGFKTSKGRVLHQVNIRNIEIKNLKPTEENLPMLEDKWRNMTNQLPRMLFNGTNLNGWKIIGDGIWMADNGVITGKTNHDDFSYLRTEETFRDYYLKLKFKIKKEHNSGVFIRQDPDSLQININTGLEINVYDHAGFSYLWPTGSVVSKARAFIGLVDYDDWNQMEIFAEGNHIISYVNGIKASEYYTKNIFNREGNICLQVGIQIASEDKSGSEVSFKDIFITSQ